MPILILEDAKSMQEIISSALEKVNEELIEISINNHKSFLYAESLNTNFARDWIRFSIKELFAKGVNSDKRLKEDIALFQQGKKSLLDLNDYVKELVMLSGYYRVLEIFNDGKFKIRLTYPHLACILLSSEKIKTKTGYSYKHLIDRFFIEQWAKGKLLYPLFINNKKRFQRKLNFEKFLQEFNIPLIKVLYEYAQSYGNLPLFKSAFYILLSTNWRYVSDVKNDEILRLQEIIESYELNTAQKKWYKNSLNFIVYALLEYGRDDLKVPYQYKQTLFPKKSIYYKKIEELVQTCPNYYPLKKEFVEYINYLDIKEQLAKGTIASKRSHLQIFIDYLIEKKCNCTMMQDTFDRMFDFSSQESIFKFLKAKKGKVSATTLKNIALFLGYTGYLSPYIKKMLPRSRSRIKETPRVPFSIHMIQGLADILMNRPPLEPTKWDRNRADTSWWKHSVYPVLPMMILLHFHIPVRGSQIRHLCRKNSFLLDERGKITEIVINTDKNRNREYLQRIPFVFNGLEIFNDFLRWHKEYYPSLPLYEYDKNSPFEKIEPLFIQPKSFKPIDKSVHFIYFKRVLAQYRIELSSKGEDAVQFVYLNEKGKEKLGKEFFEDIEELNSATNDFIDKYVKTIYDIHTFRVTGVTRYLEAGLPFNVVMMLTGHTSPNIMFNVYNKLSNEEKRRLLRSAEQKIMFDDPARITDNTKKMIYNEILPYYDKENPNKLKKILDKNALFAQKRKKSSNSEVKIDGMEEVLKISPLQWLPIVGGICPSIACPDGREKRCSLCPYFITGRYFIDGIVFRANSTVLTFYQKLEELKMDTINQKAEELEILMEEIYGWFEILNRIQNDRRENSYDLPDKKEDFIGISNIAETLAYLENFYNAKVLGTAPNLYGIKVLTIKAMKLASKNRDVEIEELINDNRKAVDYIMQNYQKAKQSPKLLTKFLTIIGENVNKITQIDNYEQK